MDISNESNEVFFKQSDVHHSTMNEPDPDNELISVGRDIGLSSGAGEGLPGASNVPLSSESVNMKNITNVLSDQFKEIQSELTQLFRSIFDETNRNMFRVQFEVTKDINLMKSDFEKKSQA